MTASALVPAAARRAAIGLAVGLALAVPLWAQAQQSTPAAVARPAVAEEGPRWQELSTAQRSALKPLERQWPGIDGSRKQKWLDIASRYPKMPAAEQARISERMTQWAALSPAERGQARLNFQEARQVTPEERQARWLAYQALSPEQRRQLAARAAPASATRSAEATRKPAGGREVGGKEAVQTKSNIVPNPAFAAPPKPVAPTVVQAQPGATTSLITKRPAPPSHQQPGMPKIAAAPGFVDKATLLPQRGPQGAAARAPEGAASRPSSTGR